MKRHDGLKSEKTLPFVKEKRFVKYNESFRFHEHDVDVFFLWNKAHRCHFSPRGHFPKLLGLF